MAAQDGGECLNLECGDESPLSHWAIPRLRDPVPKRGRIRAIQMKALSNGERAAAGAAALIQKGLT